MTKVLWGIIGAVGLLGGCTLPVKVPEVALDPPAFRRADVVQEPKPPVQIIEVPKPLPLRLPCDRAIRHSA